jgi:hypothetical protein
MFVIGPVLITLGVKRKSRRHPSGGGVLFSGSVRGAGEGSGEFSFVLRENAGQLSDFGKLQPSLIGELIDGSATKAPIAGKFLDRLGARCLKNSLHVIS